MVLSSLALGAVCLLSGLADARVVDDVFNAKAIDATAHDALLDVSPVHMRALLQSGATIDNPRVHGYLMAISFGLLLPLSVVLARNFKEYNPAWFQVHRVLNIVALVAGVVGAAFGQHIYEQDPIPDYHKNIGWAVIGLLFAQIILALFFRPPLDHKLRFAWNQAHHWLGRAAVALAIVNVFLGLHVSEEYHRFYWGYAIILAAILLLGLVKEAIDYKRLGAHHTSLRAKGQVNKQEMTSTHKGSAMDGPNDGGWGFFGRSPVSPASGASAKANGVANKEQLPTLATQEV